MNGDCPRELHGAAVVGFAIVESRHTPTLATKHYADGCLKGTATAMLIAKYDGESSYYVFGCYGNDWVSETDTFHEELDDAIEQLNHEYANLAENIVWYIGDDENT